MADLPRTPNTRQEEYLSRLAGENTTLPREPITREEMYLEGAIARVEAVEEEVEEIKNNPDVVDVVATYADLENYSTSGLTDKDIIRVLQDETHSGNSTYYRWSASTSQFDFVGEIAGSDAEFVKTLTSSDYNYPADNPQYVALWLLEPGMYTIAGSDIDWQKVLPYQANYTGIPNWSLYMTYIVLPSENESYIAFYAFTKSGITPQITYWTVNKNYPNNFYYGGETLLRSRDITNNLTSTSTTTALAAYQGKVLKDLIDNLPTGGTRTLTSADYNYHSSGSTDDGIALWLLDEGQYIIEAGANYYASIGSKSYTQQNTGVIILVKPTGTGSNERGGFIVQEQNRTLLVSRIDSTGNNGNQDVLPRSVTNNLTTTTSGYALDARQGKVLKDLIDALDARVAALEGN